MRLWACSVACNKLVGVASICQKVGWPWPPCFLHHCLPYYDLFIATRFPLCTALLRSTSKGVELYDRNCKLSVAGGKPPSLYLDIYLYQFRLYQGLDFYTALIDTFLYAFLNSPQQNNINQGRKKFWGEVGVAVSRTVSPFLPPHHN